MNYCDLIFTYGVTVIIVENGLGKSNPNSGEKLFTFGFIIKV